MYCTETPKFKKINKMVYMLWNKHGYQIKSRAVGLMLNSSKNALYNF